jgi:hypothetical protein
LSKEVIDFNLGEEPCPLNEIVRDQFTITNESGKKIKFRFDPIPSASCKLSFEPASGTIDGGKKNVKKIGVKMVLLMPESLNFRVNLRIGGTAASPLPAFIAAPPARLANLPPPTDTRVRCCWLC